MRLLALDLLDIRLVFAVIAVVVLPAAWWMMRRSRRRQTLD